MGVRRVQTRSLLLQEFLSLRDSLAARATVMWLCDPSCFAGRRDPLRAPPLYPYTIYMYSPRGT